MFKEISTERLIKYIETLPEKDQEVIAESLVKQRKKKAETDKKEYAKKLKRLNSFVRKNRIKLPPNFKFNREEAHQR